MEDQITVSVEMKVNLGNYESAGVMLSLTVSPDTTEAEMDERLAKQVIVYNKLRESLKERIAETRKLSVPMPGLPRRNA